jgi:hypothetical protein
MGCIALPAGCFGWGRSDWQTREALGEAKACHPWRFHGKLDVLTDRPPRSKTLLAKFAESDRLTQLELPPDDRLQGLAQSIESLMENGAPLAVQRACTEFITSAANFYGVPKPAVRALAARPIRVREGGWATELFGDYTPGTSAIRIWTRTAVQKRVTSFGTFLSTLCHEFCHHLDCQRFGFSQSPHTRGFYERTAALYHHARGTPRKQLVWVRMPKDRWRIDWQRMKAAPQRQTTHMRASDRPSYRPS